MTLKKSSIPILDISNVSFLVNTKKCGRGELRCRATYPDGKEASVVIEKVDEFLFRIRIMPNRTGPLHLYIDHLNDEMAT